MKNSINKSTLTFIRDLRNNNDREWFAENKQKFDAAREDFISFLDQILESSAVFEPLAQKQTGKDLIFRIYRDVRFSKNKNPYKDHFGAYLAEGGRKSIYPGYYFHLCPENQSFLACGLWMPPADFLKAVRQEIDYNLAELKQMISNPEFKTYYASLEGEKLKTNPKGYDKENPALPYLRHKSWMISHPLPDSLLTSNNLLDEILRAMEIAKPFKEFLMRPLLEISTSTQ